MHQATLKKVYKAFNRTSSKLYLRDTEIIAIRSFLKGPTSTLHICGSPGTGKTLTIKHILTRTKHTYYNYLETTSINYHTSNTKLIVIDEFDQFYKSKPKQCAKLFMYIQTHNKKLITLSNSLNTFEDVLYFSAYTTDEMVHIVRCKIKEIGDVEMDDNVVRCIVVQMGKGDMRRVFDTCRRVVEQCLEDGRMCVRMEDVVGEKGGNEEGGLGHKCVREIVKNEIKGDRKNLYKKYVENCKESCVPPLGRADFFLLYQMYKEM